MTIESNVLYMVVSIVYIIVFLYLLLKHKLNIMEHLALLSVFASLTLFIAYWIFPINTFNQALITEESKPYKNDWVPFKHIIKSFTEDITCVEQAEDRVKYSVGMVNNIFLPLVLGFGMAFLNRKRKPLRATAAAAIILLAIFILGMIRFYYYSPETTGFDSAYILFQWLGLIIGYALYKLSMKMLQLSAR
ncbi:MAG: hypothetical protein VB070_00365 [Clostridiaceae bacterium]|nr:hypothetical protein [Clostridiaceae bacterium]